MNTQTRKKFEFIELILAYEGLITNKRIREKFDVTNVQASRILSSYREQYPQNITILKGEGRGRYSITEEFRPHLTELTINNYHRTTIDGRHPVPMTSVNQDLTYIDTEIFRLMHKAVMNSIAVMIHYRSMNHPKGLDRVIHPKNFVYAGRRWHIRAYDEMTLEHRDFNLARVKSIKHTTESSDVPKDLEWDAHVNLIVKPHPLLTPDQEILVRDELFKGAAFRSIRTRKALIGYLLRELEIAENPEQHKPPEYQLYLHNVQER